MIEHVDVYKEVYLIMYTDTHESHVIVHCLYFVTEATDMAYINIIVPTNLRQ